MGVMSDLDLMVREGDRTAEDFEARGFDRERAEAMAAIVKTTNVRPSRRVRGNLLGSFTARLIYAYTRSEKINR